MRIDPLIIALTVIAAASCNRKDKDKDQSYQQQEEQRYCLTRYQMMVDCYRRYERSNHHPDYVHYLCAKKFPHDGCYYAN